MEGFSGTLAQNKYISRSPTDAKRLLIKSGQADQRHAMGSHVAAGKPGFELATSGSHFRTASQSRTTTPGPSHRNFRPLGDS